MDPTVDQHNKAKSDGAHPPEHAPKPEVDSSKDGACPAPPPPPYSPPEGSAAISENPPHPSDRSPTGAKTVSWSSELTREGPPASAAATAMPAESNPYVTPAPVQSSTSKKTMETVKGVLAKLGKKVGEATKKAEDLSRNTWQHLKTGPSFADAAMGRIAQGTKVIAEGGYEKIFRHTFDAQPEEKLKKSYACYLSTSAGPVMGILYLSTARLAFCSDNPLSYQVGDQTEWSYYKVVIPLRQLRAANPSLSKLNSAEKYIQIVSVDNHEFWLMGFVNYDSAVKNLQEAFSSAHDTQP